MTYTVRWFDTVKNVWTVLPGSPRYKTRDEASRESKRIRSPAVRYTRPEVVKER